MKKDEHFSEEQLNAFVDGELDPEEKSRFYNEAGRSPDLDHRLCQQRKVKELVKHAYENVPEPIRPGRTPLSRGRFLGRALVAGVLMVIGLAGGMLAQNYFGFGQDTGSTAAPVARINNYLLHVTGDEAEHMLAALDHARQLLDSAEAGEVVQVEIIANERGLDLVRSDITPFGREISALQDRDVVFYACSRSIERLEESGVDVRLVPHTNADYTALDRVVTRMQDGWKYEKI
ncbi:MAG: hypothetical protein OEM60_10610 [Gammaproteobacteria bacterium]|nr:hypothetical protein [Gammaproteobacteria bacterium]MDH3431575.1 hypothetical protein [Gammaproteobacteria bacterium]MDH3434302.1 hypothetical protein [Gammaproteobacteria bacterium]